MGKLDCKFDELERLECKFDELAKLECKFDELDKLYCKASPPAKASSYLRFDKPFASRPSKFIISAD